MANIKLKISKKTAFFIIFVVFFVLLDRVIVALCLSGFFNEPVSVIGNIFSLYYVKNYGIAFSLPFYGLFLNIIIGLIILSLVVFFIKSFYLSNNQTQNMSKYPLTILVVGAILNLVDRLKFGFVIDYFNLKYFTVFNLADIMIVAGVLLLIIFNRR